VNNYLIFILKKLVKKHPKQWKGRKLYPHLFRHTRLTELARGKLNEAQIRKFAGWSADSTMAKIYFHLDDEDVINILTNNVVEAPKPEPRKPKMCEICNTENNQINLFCWKCGNVFSEEDKEQMGVEAIIQPQEVKELRQENKELREEMNKLKTDYKEMSEEIHWIYADIKYKNDLEKRIKSGEISQDEARLEYSGMELTEEEKGRKSKK